MTSDEGIVEPYSVQIIVLNLAVIAALFNEHRDECDRGLCGDIKDIITIGVDFTYYQRVTVTEFCHKYGVYLESQDQVVGEPQDPCPGNTAGGEVEGETDDEVEGESDFEGEECPGETPETSNTFKQF